MRSDLAYFNLEQKALRPVRHQVVTDAVAPSASDVIGTDKSEICGEGGILCHGSKDLGNCGKIGVSGQPRWLCTSNMSGNRWLGLSSFGRDERFPLKEPSAAISTSAKR